jgi:uncharacterized protein YbcI
MQEPSGDTLPIAEQPVAISRLLVQVVAELTGRGPTKVRTDVSDHVITVVMRDTLTQAERNLVADGYTDLVVEMRRAFQRTMSPTVIPAIEAITGRRIYAFLSDHSVNPDVSIETFVLAQPGDPKDVDPTPDGPER